MSDTPQTPETPAPTQTPSQPVSMRNSEGNWSQDYLNSLPDDLGKHSSFKKYKTPDEYFKGSINAQNLVGQKAEDFWRSEDAEHVAKRREIMGVPKDAAGYDFNIGDLPEGMNAETVNQRVEKAKEKFLELNVSKDVAEKMIQYDLESMRDQHIAAEDARIVAQTEAQDSLRAEWKGEKYDNNIEKARNALEHLGLDWANDPAFGDNPKLIKDVFEKLVPLISDDRIIEARQHQSEQTLSDQWDSQFGKMQGMDKNDPAYPAEVRIMEEITRKMN